MPNISEQLPNLMNGISQQAVSMRMASQGEKQVNGLSSIVKGNTKRPPTEHIAKLTSGSFSGSMIKTINRDLQERYKVIFTGSDVRVFDLDGSEKPVSFPDGKSYIQTPDPIRNLRALTVGDYTFVVNRTAKVEKSNSRTPDPGTDAMVFIKSASLEVIYRIYVNGTQVADWRTDDGGNDNISEFVAGLYGRATDRLPSSDWDITQSGPVIHFSRKDGGDFDLEVTDEDGNKNTVMIRDVVDSMADLPVEAKDGFVVRVLGDESSNQDDYYVRFVTTNGETFGRGYWEETVAPGIEHELDASTMPHSLVRTADGDFELRQVEWGGRVSGDYDTAEWPSFVGRRINSMYLDRRRLCICAGNTISMSRARALFDFFPETVMSVLDDGPIGVSTPGNAVADLLSAQAFERKIILFGEQAQYVIEDDYLLATKPPALKEVTSYETQSYAEPVNSGRMVYLPTANGRWSGLLEYYTLADSETTDATEVTEHVPEYVPADVFHMTSSGIQQMVLSLTTATPSRVFVYKHHWRGNEKLQSSWSDWKFPDEGEIISAGFVNDVVYMLVEYPDGVFLEKLDLGSGGKDVSEDFAFCLDRRITEADTSAMIFDLDANETSFDIPYVPPEGTIVATRKGDGTSDTPPATAPDVVAVDGNRLTVRGDLRDTQFYVGVPYAHIYTFSEPVLSTSSGSGGKASVIAGRLQIARWSVRYDNTGYFRFEVKHEARPVPYIHEVSHITLGTVTSKVGELELASGTARSSAKGRSDQIEVTLINDSFLPSAFTAAEWEGRFSRRTSRV